MKINYKRQFFFFLIIILISGCGKDITNETFSCDKSTNQWAHDNYSTLSKMNRNDLSNLKVKIR